MKAKTYFYGRGHRHAQVGTPLVLVQRSYAHLPSWAYSAVINGYIDLVNAKAMKLTFENFRKNLNLINGTVTDLIPILREFGLVTEEPTYEWLIRLYSRLPVDLRGVADAYGTASVTFRDSLHVHLTYKSYLYKD